MANWLLIFSALLIVVNLTAFILVGMDKKRSVENTDRIREVYLFFIAIFFASLGVLLGMYFFRNKTRKVYFPLGIGLLMLEQAALLILLAQRFS
jgi:uncharacterized membrane protein YsdA (DUF1294 family)